MMLIDDLKRDRELPEVGREHKAPHLREVSLIVLWVVGELMLSDPLILPSHFFLVTQSVFL